MNGRKVIRWFAAVLVLVLAGHFVVLGRQLTANDGFSREALDALATARTTWQAANIDDYTWSATLSCFCAPSSFRVRVLDGHPVDLFVDGRPGAKWEYRSFPMLVDDLFDRIGTPYATNASYVDVAYDRALGYPTRMGIDPEPFRPDSMTFDDDYELRVMSLVPTTT